MQAAFVSTMNGLLPMDDASRGVLRRAGMGGVVSAEYTVMRNGPFFRKWWALCKVAFDLWEETRDPVKHNDTEIQADFDRFRHDLTIMAGHYNVTVNARNESRLDAKSISFAKMTEEQFEAFYSQTINAVLSKILKPNTITQERLEEMVFQVLRFD